MLFPGFLLGQASGAISFTSDNVLDRVGGPCRHPPANHFQHHHFHFPPKSSKEGLNIYSHHVNIFPFPLFGLATETFLAALMTVLVSGPGIESFFFWWCSVLLLRVGRGIDYKEEEEMNTSPHFHHTFCGLDNMCY